MSINHNHLALFQAVAEEGSFGRGAERMRVSQPAVSKQIGQFEKTIGLKLLERLPRGVRLTTAGEKLLVYAQQISEINQQAEFALEQLSGLKTGELAIGASTTIGVYLLPEVLGAFHRQYPGIKLHLEIVNTQRVQELLVQHKLDIGLTEGLRDKPAQKYLKAKDFYNDELVVVATPGHPLCHAKQVTAQQLTKYPLLVREPGSGTRAVIENALAQHKLTIEPAMSIGSTGAIKRAVAAGIGIGIVSRLAIAQELQLGKLAIVPMRDLKILRPLHRLRLASAKRNRVVQAFIKVLNSTITKTPPERFRP